MTKKIARVCTLDIKTHTYVRYDLNLTQDIFSGYEPATTQLQVHTDWYEIPKFDSENKDFMKHRLDRVQSEIIILMNLC